MKKICAALAAAGFWVAMTGPALAGGGCGSFSPQSVGLPGGDNATVAQGEQSTPTTTVTQTASTEAATE